MDGEAWDRRYAGRELIWTAEPNRSLVAETEGLAPGRAIDLACGEGRNALWLAGAAGRQRAWISPASGCKRRMSSPMRAG